MTKPVSDAYLLGFYRQQIDMTEFILSLRLYDDLRLPCVGMMMDINGSPPAKDAPPELLAAWEELMAVTRALAFAVDGKAQ